MSMDYHFEVEQEVGSSAYAFFGFNGRKKPLASTESHIFSPASFFLSLWNVEVKMMLIQKIFMKGLPVYGGYLQSTRSEDGEIVRRAVEDMDLAKASLWKKLYVIYSFFFVRKIVIHIFTFIFHWVVLPATVLVPEVLKSPHGHLFTFLSP
ncbi:hypothetical protein RHMOL_Rhmol09G0013500 [Rhododendron molle]|uniref:Uncharacterized protein n=1 Tax=Rhododendron molle TaxID=49168 RepID=A0ACC0MA77_RHOML|nr:hypothetical protein RHMOL_Rhmol09G0013500 [Rhododendron molle]